MAGKIRLGTLRFQRPIKVITAGPGGLFQGPYVIGDNSSLRILVGPRPQPQQIWYGEDELPQQAASLDAGIWINGPAGQFVFAKPVASDEDVLVPSIAIDEMYEWRSSYGPYSYARPITADEDVWVASIPVDDQESINGVQVQWKQGFAVLSDDEWVPQAATIVEDDYWLIGRYSIYGYSQAIVADDEWIRSIPVDEDIPALPQQSSTWNLARAITADDEWVPQPPTTAIDDDYWFINKYSPYVTPLQAFAFEEDRVTPPTPFGLDEDGLFIPQLAGQYNFGRAFTSDDDAWVPNISPPNLHRLVMDINTGRLGWIVSGTHTGSPILIQLLD